MDILKLVKTVAFISQKKLCHLFSKTWRHLCGLSIVVIILTAIFYSMLINFIIENNPLTKNNMKIEIIFYIINLIFSVLIILRRTFPVYLFYTDIVPKEYPVTEKERLVINISFDLMNYFWVFAFFFHFGLYCFVELYTLKFLTLSILTLAASVLLENNFKMMFERRIKINRKVHAITTITSILIISVGYFIFVNALFPVIALLTLAILFLQLHLALQDKIEIIESDPAKDRRYHFNFFYILFKNRAFKKIYYLQIFYKIFVIFLFTISLILKKQSFLPQFLFWLILTPATLFTYLFNNFFAFFHSLFATLNLNSTDYKSYLKIYFVCISVPLLIDTVIFIIAILIFNQASAEAFTFYLCSTINLTVLGFLVSLRKPHPVPVDYKLQFNKNTTSFMANFLSLTVLGCYYIAFERGSMIFLCFIFISILLLLFLYFFKSRFQPLRQQIFLKIYY